MKKFVYIFLILSLLGLVSCSKKNGNGNDPIPNIPSVDINFSGSQASFDIANDGPSRLEHGLGY